MQVGSIENIEAEQAVLGSIFLESELVKETSLTMDHFSHPAHKMIFKVMREIDQVDEKVDFVTVVSRLGKSIEQVGNVSYLSQLTDSVPTTANFSTYEGMIFEAFRLREAKSIASEYILSPSEEKFTEVYKRFAELQEIGIKPNRGKQDILMEVTDEMNTNQEDLTGVDTGFIVLNNMTGGLQSGDLIIVAARPSMGKTAFALNLAMQNCSKGGVSTIFSLEMSDKQLIQRMLSAMGEIHGSKWRNPYKLFTNQDHDQALHAIGIFDQWDINIFDQSGQTASDVRAAIRKSMKDFPDRKHLVIIDYLQLITPVGRFERHDLAIGQITRELKKIAREFDVPIILLSQLSRAVEQRRDKRPMMSDLRDSGSIEADADIVALLYRDDYYHKNSDVKNIVEVILAKHRNGPVGAVQLTFEKEYGLFQDVR